MSEPCLKRTTTFAHCAIQFVSDIFFSIALLTGPTEMGEGPKRVGGTLFVNRFYAGKFLKVKKFGQKGYFYNFYIP